jgi:predicted RNA-binding protein (TIGR00451 family)
VLSGATLMVPGLTSTGGRLPAKENELKEGEVVVVTAEGKEEACMVGVLKMGTEEMKSLGKGVAVENGHYLGDGLWKMHLD